MTAKEEVLSFLRDFQYKLDFRGLRLRIDRTSSKNEKTLWELDYEIRHVKEVLKNLKLEDYSDGPLPDTLYKISEMWVFGKVIKGKEVYIKVQLGYPNENTICISFHFSEYAMKFPFKC